MHKYKTHLYNRMPLVARIVCSASKEAGPPGKKNDNMKKRFEQVRADLKMVVEQRRINLMAVNTSFREALAQENEMRQVLFDKWSAIAKEDIAALAATCKKPCQDSNNYVYTDTEPVEFTQPPAAEAFYEPWVKDD